MYRVIYTTYLGGIESQACRRFANSYKAKSFARLVNGTIEKAARSCYL
jgi:hypothetical protein